MENNEFIPEELGKDDFQPSKKENILTNPMAILSICISIASVFITYKQLELSEKEDKRKEKETEITLRVKNTEVALKISEFFLNNKDSINTTKDISQRKAYLTMIGTLCQSISEDERETLFEAYKNLIAAPLLSGVEREEIRNLELYPPYIVMHYRSKEDTNAVQQLSRNLSETTGIEVRNATKPILVTQQVFGGKRIDVRYFFTEDSVYAEKVKASIKENRRGDEPTLIDNRGKYKASRGLIEVWADSLGAK